MLRLIKLFVFIENAKIQQMKLNGLFSYSGNAANGARVDPTACCDAKYNDWTSMIGWPVQGKQSGFM